MTVSALCFVFQDGAFMVRKSSGHDIHQPYTLVVFYKGRVYNIPIRFIPGTEQYALGRQKRGEEVGVASVSWSTPWNLEGLI